MSDSGGRGTLSAVTSNQMSYETHMHLLLLTELMSALRANDPETFKRWLAGGVDDLGSATVDELMQHGLTPLLTQPEADRLVGWHLGVKFKLFPAKFFELIFL